MGDIQHVKCITLEKQTEVVCYSNETRQRKEKRGGDREEEEENEGDSADEEEEEEEEEEIAMRDAAEQHNGKASLANDRGVIVPSQCKVIHLRFSRRHQSYRSIEISPSASGVFQLH